MMELHDSNQSVRPPAAERPGRAREADPLDGWDQEPAHPDDESHQQHQWAVALGSMGAGAVIGAASGAGVARRLRRAAVGAAVGAVAAVVGMQSWTRPAEDDEWARRHARR